MAEQAFGKKLTRVFPEVFHFRDLGLDEKTKQATVLQVRHENRPLVSGGDGGSVYGWWGTTPLVTNPLISHLHNSMQAIRDLALAFIAVSTLHAAAPPNIIFILSDDLAQGDVGVYGQKIIQTPRLDRMAAEGTRFNQAYCGTSVCAPSRASLRFGRQICICSHFISSSVKYFTRTFLNSLVE